MRPLPHSRGKNRLRIGLSFNVRLANRVRQPASFSSNLQQRSPAQIALGSDDTDEEFDSSETIQALAGVLESFGHEVELLGDGEPLVRRLLSGPRPELVWNIAEGTGGGRAREARVPAVLEMFDIPYTGSDPLTLAATLDKDCAKRLVSFSGVSTPPWVLFDGNWIAAQPGLAKLHFPVFVKPAFEGSSKGILATSIIADLKPLKQALEQLFETYRQPVLVEEFIDGDELTVGLVGNRPPEVIGIMRVLPRGPTKGPFVYSLDVKRDWQRQARYECPAQLSPHDTQAVRAAALACWHALGCRDVSRFDFRLRKGVAYYLETNPLPGLSPISGDLVLLSGSLGIEYPDLIARILQAALERLNLVHDAPVVG
jgi:D-alanine-D-alanine ligase